MFTLCFQTPSGRQWCLEGLTRTQVEEKGAIALRYDANNIVVINPYGTDVTHTFRVFR